MPLFDKCKYILPLDEYGEVIKPEIKKDYESKIEKYLSTLMVDKEEIELKRIFLNLECNKKIVHFSSPSIVDKYSIDKLSTTAMHDLYNKSYKGDDHKTSNFVIFKKYALNDENIELAKRYRSIYEDGVAKYGVNDYRPINYPMNKATYSIICHMRDHEVDPTWAAYFVGMVDIYASVLKVYDGFVYSMFKEEA